jgi:HEAT repeat protein
VDPTLAALSKRTSDEGMFWPALNSVARCDNEIRALAAQGLGRIRDAEAVSALQSLLHPDVDDNVAKAAAAALGEIGDPASIPLLADLLLRPPHRVIDESDVDFDDPEDVEFARELWEMEDEVPVAAARALAAIGTPDARRALEEAAAGELQSAARAARAALAARP